jgi:nucleoid DNA-binding protein
MTKHGYVIRDSYKGYKSSVKEPLEKKEYLEIAYGFMEFMMEKIFDGHTVKIPERLGVVEIKGRKQKIKIDKETDAISGLAPDWKATNDLWRRDPLAKSKKKMIFLLNEHTGGIRYKINWSKLNVLVENKSAYALIFSRANKRRLAKIIKETKKEYTIL